MRSFKLKTVVLSMFLSGTLLISTGFLGWSWLRDELRSSLDFKIILPGQRIAEYHGWKTDWERFQETIDLAIGKEWQNDRILKVRSNLRSRNTLYESDNWPEGFPHEDLPNFDELKDRIRMIKHDEAGGFVRYSLLEEPYLYTKAFDGGRWRMATITNPELTLYIGISLSSYFAEIRQLRFVYFGGLIAVILGIGFGGYWIARKALKPVDAIAIAAKCFTSKDLAKRIPVSSEYDLEFDSRRALIKRCDSARMFRTSLRLPWQLFKTRFPLDFKTSVRIRPNATPSTVCWKKCRDLRALYGAFRCYRKRMLARCL
jgi:hypothetical protein